MQIQKARSVFRINLPYQFQTQTDGLIIPLMIEIILCLFQLFRNSLGVYNSDIAGDFTDNSGFYFLAFTVRTFFTFSHNYSLKKYYQPNPWQEETDKVLSCTEGNSRMGVKISKATMRKSFLLFMASNDKFGRPNPGDP